MVFIVFRLIDFLVLNFHYFEAYIFNFHLNHYSYFLLINKAHIYLLISKIQAAYIKYIYFKVFGWTFAPKSFKYCIEKLTSI